MRTLVTFSLGLAVGFALAWKLTERDRQAAMQHQTGEAAFAYHNQTMDDERRERIGGMGSAERADYEARMALVRKAMEDEGIDTEEIF